MLVTTPAELHFRVRFNLSNPKAFDIETTGLNCYGEDNLLGIAFSDGSNSVYFCPIKHPIDREAMRSYDWKTALQPLFDGGTWIGWNSKFDCQFLRQAGVDLSQAVVIDAMLLWHLANENLTTYALKPMASLFLDKMAQHEEAVLEKHIQEISDNPRKKADKGEMWRLSPEIVAPYAEQDALMTYQLYQKVIPLLKADGLLDIGSEICDYARVIEDIEQAGIKVNRKKCAEETARCHARVEELRQELESHTWPGFNPGSWQQVCRWLGIASSAKDKLEELNDSRVDLLLEYRGLSKAVSSFYQPWVDRADRNGRVHASFKIHGTVTSRLSCMSPNLQQLPRTSKEWHRARHFVEAPRGWTLIGADLSQAELRLMAHYSEDPFLLRAYCEEGLDIHQMVATELGIDRTAAKNLNFGMCYGAGAARFAYMLKISEAAAKDVLKAHNVLMPGVKKLSHMLVAQAERDGYIKLWTGRLRRYPKQFGLKDKSYTAMNNIIQGGVAEIIRVSMQRLSDELPAHCRMVCQVHDEILFECKSERTVETCKQIKAIMEDYHFRVPIVAEPKTGRTWGSLAPLS
jgi:DNA polymerase-1